jgi:hypothetical protein
MEMAPPTNAGRRNFPTAKTKALLFAPSQNFPYTFRRACHNSFVTLLYNGSLYQPGMLGQDLYPFIFRKRSILVSLFVQRFVFPDKV